MSKPRQPAGRFLSPSASNPRAYRSRPLRELPLLADDEDRRREVERVRDTTSIRDEPESVGPAILGDWEEVRQLHRSQQHAIEVAAMRQARPMLALEDRVRDIQRRARQSGYDLRRETALMRRDIERAKAGNRHPPARVEKRCEGLEALLDGVVQREAA